MIRVQYTYYTLNPFFYANLHFLMQTSIFLCKPPFFNANHNFLCKSPFFMQTSIFYANLHFYPNLHFLCKPAFFMQTSIFYANLLFYAKLHYFRCIDPSEHCCNPEEDINCKVQPCCQAVLDYNNRSKDRHLPKVIDLIRILCM